MAIKTQGAGLDFLKVGVIKDALSNPLTTTLKNTLATTLGAAHKGLIVYDTDLLRLQSWNGTAFVDPPSAQTGLTPKGNVAFNATVPVSPIIGDLYVFSSAGSNTWQGTNVVQVGDQVYWDGTTWQFIQGNTVSSTEAIAGIIAIATQALTNTGTDDSTAITPLKLATFIGATKKLAKTYFVSSVTTVADTPLTINHALALQNRDAFVLSFKVGNSDEGVDYDSVDVNNCTITTGSARTGSVFITGY